MIEGKKFWMVWNPSTGRTNYQHPTKELALREARRLTGQHVNDAFYVLEAVARVAPAAPPVEVTELASPSEEEIATAHAAAVKDDGIPF